MNKWLYIDPDGKGPRWVNLQNEQRYLNNELARGNTAWALKQAALYGIDLGRSYNWIDNRAPANGGGTVVVNPDPVESGGTTPTNGVGLPPSNGGGLDIGGFDINNAALAIAGVAAFMFVINLFRG